MNRLLNFIPLIFICFILSACGATTVTRVNLNTGLELPEGERCPVGDTCLTDVNTGDSLAGGGVGRSLTMGTEGDCVARHPNGAPVQDARGQVVMERCKQQSVASGFVPPHSDVFIPKVFDMVTGLGSAGIMRDGHVVAAGKNAAAIKYAADAQSRAIENAGPNAVSFTDVRTYTNTDVGVGVQQTETTQYFDPTQ